GEPGAAPTGRAAYPVRSAFISGGAAMSLLTCLRRRGTPRGLAIPATARSTTRAIHDRRARGWRWREGCAARPDGAGGWRYLRLGCSWGERTSPNILFCLRHYAPTRPPQLSRCVSLRVREWLKNGTGGMT